MSTRADLRSARRVVVKVGSSSLTTREGGLDAGRLGALVEAQEQEPLGPQGAGEVFQHPRAEGSGQVHQTEHPVASPHQPDRLVGAAE